MSNFYRYRNVFFFMVKIYRYMAVSRFSSGAINNMKSKSLETVSGYFTVMKIRWLNVFKNIIWSKDLNSD